jgi:hypothetical protein
MAEMHGIGPRHSLPAALAALGVLSGAHAALAETFPAALDMATVQDWLRRETNTTPDQVVAISPSAATRIMSIEEPAPGRRRAQVEAQALSAQAAARTGVLTWRMPLDVDCGSGRVKLGPTVGYASRRGVGPAVPLRAADAVWREAPAGTQLDFLRKAACARRDGTVKTSTNAPAKPPPPPLREAKSASAPRPIKIGHQTSTRTTGLAVQVISSPDKGEAEAALRRLQGRFGPQTAGLQPAVARAEVRGSTTYRGMLTGFASRQAAASFCTELQGAKLACFLRQAPEPPLKPVATK